MKTSQECLHHCQSWSTSSGCRPHRPYLSSWWQWTQSHQIHLWPLLLWYVVSHLPIMIAPESSSNLQLIHRIPLYWGWYFFQRRSIFQCYPTECSQIPWSINIHQRPRLRTVYGLVQKFCGVITAVVSMPQWMKSYFIWVLILERFLLPEVLMLHFHSMLLLLRLLLPGLILLHFSSLW